MSRVTVNGFSALAAELSMPLHGPWHCDAVVDSPDVVEGAVEIASEGIKFKGYARRVGVFNDTLALRIVGGAGGFGRVLTPKSYLNVTASNVFQDILKAAGETMSVHSSQASTSKFFSAWAYADMHCGIAMTSICSVVGAQWRVLRDGTTWVGAETWKKVTGENQLKHHDTITGRKTYWVDAPFLSAGEEFDDRRAGFVQYTLAEDGGLTMSTWEAYE